MSKPSVPCDAVLLLMQRMESHPDEFKLNTSSKWHELFSVIKRRVVDKDANAVIILDDFEAVMLWGKFKEAGKRSLHNYVMDTILRGDEKKDD